jgi:hypothetical protein
MSWENQQEYSTNRSQGRYTVNSGALVAGPYHNASDFVPFGYERKLLTNNNNKKIVFCLWLVSLFFFFIWLFKLHFVQTNCVLQGMDSIYSEKTHLAWYYYCGLTTKHFLISQITKIKIKNPMVFIISHLKPGFIFDLWYVMRWEYPITLPEYSISITLKNKIKTHFCNILNLRTPPSIWTSKIHVN